MTTTINTIDFEPSLRPILPKLIIDGLDTEGYVLVKNYPINFDDPSSTLLGLSSEVGTPISHDDKNTLVWDIKLNASSKSNIITYSEHSHDAVLHTDSQYSLYPEDYFSMLCLKKAGCGGGISCLLTLSSVLADLRDTKKGNTCIDILNKQMFPFLVPSVFSKEGANEFEFNYGYILQENEIRFRIDTIEKALELNPEFQTPDRLLAFEMLKNAILNSDKKIYFSLEDGDIVFLNNKTILHGRSSFTDSERYLLRVRMNKKQLGHHS